MQREVVGSSRLDVSSTIASKGTQNILCLRIVWLSENSDLPGGLCYGTAHPLTVPLCLPQALSDRIKKCGDAIAEVKVKRTVGLITSCR